MWGIKIAISFITIMHVYLEKMLKCGNAVIAVLLADFKPRSDDDRKEERSGRGRKKDRRNVSQEEKPPTILKKHEEQKSVVS